MKTRMFLCVPALLLWALAPATSAAEDFVVVVNAENPITTLSASEASKIFLKKTTNWGDGQPIMAVELAPASAARKGFTTDVHRRTVSQIETYWQQQLFGGRSVPPEVLDSDQAILDYVRTHPGAVAYVSADVALGDGVKSIPVAQ